MMENALPLAYDKRTFALGERVAELHMPPTAGRCRAIWHCERDHRIGAINIFQIEERYLLPG